MESNRKYKTIAKHLIIGAVVPVILLFGAFLIPEPYSHPIINIAIAPTKLMTFLENRELMRELTLSVFGRMTPNYAPITILFLTVFWFLIGVLASIAFRYISEQKKNA